MERTYTNINSMEMLFLFGRSAHVQSIFILWGVLRVLRAEHEVQEYHSGCFVISFISRTSSWDEQSVS